MKKPGRTFQTESKGQRPEARKGLANTVKKLEVTITSVGWGLTEQLGSEACLIGWGCEYWHFNLSYVVNPGES